jgi:hypothetical protein
MSRKLPVDVHPAANIFPMMAADEFEGLKSDIRANGVREPLTMWKGHLIDGRNRMAACIDLSIDWHAHLCELDSDEDPVAYVISHNLHRRHLGPGQKAMVADKIRAYYDQQAKQRMSDGGKSAGKGRKKQGPEKLPDPKNGDSRDAAGAAVGVSGRLVDAARTVRRLGSAALIESVESGKVSVSKASRVAKAHDKQSQVAALNDKPSKPKQDVFSKLRKVFDAMNVAQRRQAAVIWEDWLAE